MTLSDISLNLKQSRNNKHRAYHIIVMLMGVYQHEAKQMKIVDKINLKFDQSRLICPCLIETIHMGGCLRQKILCILQPI